MGMRAIEEKKPRQLKERIVEATGRNFANNVGCGRKKEN
jgi:hypothetical protein